MELFFVNIKFYISLWVGSVSVIISNDHAALVTDQIYDQPLACHQPFLELPLMVKHTYN